MALRYRNEYVLSSLRNAYTLKYCDDSLLLNESHDATFPTRNPSDLEADLADLSLRLRSDSHSEIRYTSTSQSSTSISGNADTDSHDTDDDDDDDDDDDLFRTPMNSDESGIHEKQQSDSDSSEMMMMVATPRRSNSSRTGLECVMETQLENETHSSTDAGSHMGSQMGSQNGSQNGSQVGSQTEADGEPETSTIVSSYVDHFPNVQAQQFHQIKDFGLDMEDNDSDFEDGILQATQEIKHNAQKQQQQQQQQQQRPPQRSQRRPQQHSSPHQLTQQQLQQLPQLQFQLQQEQCKTGQLSQAQSVRSNASRRSDASLERTRSPSSRASSTYEPVDLFVKRETPALNSPKCSRLTSKLNISHNDPKEQYMEAIAGLETSGVRGFQFTMNVRGHEPFELTVKQDCTTHLAIGYALLKAGIEPGDANMYNLSMVEDDGEIDEDFACLGRTRPIASYGYHNFAIVKASEAEFRSNSKTTPNKISFKGVASASTTALADPAMSNPQTLPENGVVDTFPGGAGAASGRGGISVGGGGGAGAGGGGGNPSDANLRRARQQDSHFGRHQRQSSPKLSGKPTHGFNPSYSSFSGSKLDSVVVKIYKHPYKSLLTDAFWTDEMVPQQNRIEEVFAQMCREKMMDSDMYVLRSVEPPHQIIRMSRLVGSLITNSSSGTGNTGTGTRNTSTAAPGSLAPLASGSLVPASAVDSAGHAGMGANHVLNLELIALRDLPSHQQSAQGRPSLQEDGQNARALAKKRSSNDILQNTVLAMQPLGFYKYPVLRRQQITFLGRGERELVIDGEHIHIMPPTDWSLNDQPKTSTFHIKQVMNIKQSNKTSTHFSILVLKANGPKKYDLEALDTANAVEIVDRLMRLKRAQSKKKGH